jgi:hypothetical protein
MSASERKKAKPGDSADAAYLNKNRSFPCFAGTDKV